MFKTSLILFTLLGFSALCPAQSFTSAAGLGVSGSIKVDTARPLLVPSANVAVAPDPAVQSIERQTFDLINKQRCADGDELLVWSEQAAEVARRHSKDMASAGFFSHRGTDGSMVDDRAGQVGLKDWAAIGENIAFVGGGQDAVEVAVREWMKSQAHRTNLLDKRWKESAIGAAVLPDGTVFFTQVFIVRF